jgi:hypothetical protein
MKVYQTMVRIVVANPWIRKNFNFNKKVKKEDLIKRGMTKRNPRNAVKVKAVPLYELNGMYYSLH